MANLNLVVLTGRLTSDPNFKLVSPEKPVVNFSMAVNGIPQKNGEKIVDFFNCTAWNRLAEICHEYLFKGRLIAIKGRLKNDIFEVQSEKRTKTYILVTEMEMLDRKNLEEKNLPPLEETI